MNDQPTADPPESPTPAPAPAPEKSGLPHGLVAGLVAVVAVVFAIGVLAFANRQSATAVDPQRTLSHLGIDTTEVTTRMAEGYTDEDQDMVADSPADPAELQDPATLVFSYLSGEAQGVDPQRWQPLLDHLQSELGRPVQYVALTDVKAQLEALRGGGLHITAFNTGNTPRAVNTAGFLPLVCPGNAGEANAYQMLIIAAADAGLKTPDDLRGKSIAFTRVGSNSGYKAPIVTLRDQFSLLPERDYDWAFSGGHDQSIRGVAEGSWPAAAVAGSLFRAAINRGDFKAEQFEMIYQSEPFPVAAVGCPHNLKPELEEKIKQALLSFKIAGTALADELAGQPADGFVEISYKNDFATTRLIDSAFKAGS